MKKITSAWAGAALVLICIASFGLMLWAARTDSAIVDEQAHIPAGYGYVSLLDYRLNPEHPPLIKALAELPVAMFVRPTFPITRSSWTDEVNSQWAIGYDFLYYSGNNADQIIQVGRVMPILITILALILVYFLARRFMGPLWALVPAFMFGLDPNVIAHGHYVTTDVGAALGVLLSFIFFFRFLDRPTTKHLWLAGIAFGIAQIAKFSTPLIAILFIFLGIVLWIRDLMQQWNSTASRGARAKLFFRKLGWYAGRIALIIVIGYAVIVYPTYSLFTAHEPIAKQAYDTQYILGSFAGGAPAPGTACHGMRCLADLDIAMAHNPITRPIAQYMLGVLMVMQRADGGNTIYFLGAVRQAGGWIYFPTLFLLKEPIPTLAIVIFALLLSIAWMLRNMRRRMILDYLTNHFGEFALGSFVILYWGYSVRSPLNIGIRHLMPTIPLIFILSAGVWRKWVLKIASATTGTFDDPAGMILAAMDNAKRMIRSAGFIAVKYMLLIALLAWLTLETLFAAPHFLSYFNEFAGGTTNGYHFVTDSNYDWGQDLLRLKDFVNAHPEIDKIAVDYFGGGNPAYYLGTNKEVKWSSAQGDPRAQGIHWLAVSVNTLELATQPLAPGGARNASDSYAWLPALRSPADDAGTFFGGNMGNLPVPDYRAGTSIFIYHLP